MTYLVIVLLLVVSGLFSGLTLGLMSLEPNELKRKAKLGDLRAETLYPLRARGNRLLVSLILGDVIANASLAIFLGTITTALLAGIISTFLITIFGEVVPQSIFPRFALTLGASMSGFVRLVMIILFPIAWPIAWVLDEILGAELPTMYSKKELIEILEEHGESKTSDVRRDEEKIASGALSFGEKQVQDVMTPRSVVISLHADSFLDEDMVKKLIKHGYSLFPVLDEQGNRVIGLLYAYRLIGHDNAIGKHARHAWDTNVHYVNEDETLDKALKGFIKTKQRLFIVVNQYAEYVGVLTIEDILGEILGEEIVDEFNEYKDLHKVATKVAKVSEAR